jgi:hypothetical protein
LKTKTCAYCHKRQPLTEYHRARANRDGLFRRCKACCAAIRRLRYLKNREQVLDQQREYYSARREEILAAHKEYSKANPEYAREYYRRNREKLLEYGRKYRQRKKAGIT